MLRYFIQIVIAVVFRLVRGRQYLRQVVNSSATANRSWICSFEVQTHTYPYIKQKTYIYIGK